MIPYITYREPDEYNRLCFYIMQKKFPHYIGMLITSPREGALVNAPVPNYNFWITYAGCLEGNFLPGYNGVLEEVENVFSNMATWYYENRLRTEPKKYEKFKVNDKSTTE